MDTTQVVYFLDLFGALCGSFIYVMMKSIGLPAPQCLIVSVAVTLLIRLAAIRWGLSLPVLQSDDGMDTLSRAGGSREVGGAGVKNR